MKIFWQPWGCRGCPHQKNCACLPLFDQKRPKAVVRPWLMLQKIYFMVFERYIPELKKYDSNSFLHQPMASGQPLKIVQRHMAHPVVDMNDVIWQIFIVHCFLLMLLLENATLPWGQSREWILHKHSCIHHSTCACAKPIPEIVPMLKLDIADECWMDDFGDYYFTNLCNRKRRRTKS